ncbi:hypothetical protein RVBP17_3340 [Pseudomonas phage sp. 30-3]|nr:hypothetical protein RVBP17_3340 [Pseudomonas phage sp. 30-3]
MNIIINIQESTSEIFFDTYYITLTSSLGGHVLSINRRTGKGAIILHNIKLDHIYPIILLQNATVSLVVWGAVDIKVSFKDIYDEYIFLAIGRRHYSDYA